MTQFEARFRNELINLDLTSQQTDVVYELGNNITISGFKTCIYLGMTSVYGDISGSDSHDCEKQ